MADKNENAPIVTDAPAQETTSAEQAKGAQAAADEAKTTKADKPKANKRVNLKKELAKQKGATGTGYTAYIRARIKAGK